MASSASNAAGISLEAIPAIINSITNLYQIVAAKSPHVADTVVILAASFPFYMAFIWLCGMRTGEKKQDKKVKDAREASKKPGKGNPKRRKP